MRVRADHQRARRGIVFQHHLVNNPGTGFPEADAVFVGHVTQKVVDLVVLVLGRLQISFGANLGADQVIAMGGGWHSHLVPTSLHELQQGHLRRRILHGNAIRAQLQIARATLILLPLNVVKMRPQDFLGQRDRPFQPLAGDLVFGSH